MLHLPAYTQFKSFLCYERIGLEIYSTSCGNAAQFVEFFLFFHEMTLPVVPISGTTFQSDAKSLLHPLVELSEDRYNDSLVRYVVLVTKKNWRLEKDEQKSTVCKFWSRIETDSI